MHSVTVYCGLFRIFAKDPKEKGYGNNVRDFLQAA